MITFHQISKIYGDHRTAKNVLHDISFVVQKGELLTIFGPNGCGKSTLMSILAGLEKASGGKINSDENLAGNIGYVFQDYRKSLFPWLNVAENIIFPLRLRREGKKQILKKLDKLYRLIKLPLDLKQRVYTLSGGQAQLVAIMRALIIEPKLLILDEPFSAIDYERTLFLRQKVLEITQQLELTTLFVSHDLDEAIYLGDKVIFLSRSPAVVRQVMDVPFGAPRNLKLLGSPEFAALKLKALEILQIDEFGAF